MVSESKTNRIVTCTKRCSEMLLPSCTLSFLIKAETLFIAGDTRTAFEARVEATSSTVVDCTVAFTFIAKAVFSRHARIISVWLASIISLLYRGVYFPCKLFKRLNCDKSLSTCVCKRTVK